tara:strand:+ start:246 stop:437 length:192 start_codon:yes stop_codon:yes gene_type:complete
MCKKRLEQLGFGKIIFSNKCGNFEKHTIDTYKKTHLTSWQRYNKIFYGDLIKTKKITKRIEQI